MPAACSGLPAALDHRAALILAPRKHRHHYHDVLVRKRPAIRQLSDGKWAS